jgi:hypothetical protein
MYRGVRDALFADCKSEMDAGLQSGRDIGTGGIKETSGKLRRNFCFCRRKRYKENNFFTGRVS